MNTIFEFDKLCLKQYNRLMRRINLIGRDIRMDHGNGVALKI